MDLKIHAYELTNGRNRAYKLTDRKKNHAYGLTDQRSHAYELTDGQNHAHELRMHKSHAYKRVLVSECRKMMELKSLPTIKEIAIVKMQT